jgi:hypothetical protein
MALLGDSAMGQPKNEFVDRKLKDIQARTRVEPKGGDDALRRLLIERYNVAVEEVQNRCEDFKKGLSTLDGVLQADRNLVVVELEMLTDPKQKIKTLERAIELARWYEGELEKALKAGVGHQAEVLRIRGIRLTLEIQRLRVK